MSWQPPDDWPPYETIDVPGRPPERTPWVRRELPDGTIVLRFSWWEWLKIKLRIARVRLAGDLLPKSD